MARIKIASALSSPRFHKEIRRPKLIYVASALSNPRIDKDLRIPKLTYVPQGNQPAPLFRFPASTSADQAYSTPTTSPPLFAQSQPLAPSSIFPPSTQNPLPSPSNTAQGVISAPPSQNTAGRSIFTPGTPNLSFTASPPGPGTTNFFDIPNSAITPTFSTNASTQERSNVDVSPAATIFAPQSELRDRNQPQTAAESSGLGSISPRSGTPFPEAAPNTIAAKAAAVLNSSLQPELVPRDSPTNISRQAQSEAVETVARLGLVQKDGLLDQLVDFQIPGLIRNLFAVWDCHRQGSLQFERRRRHLEDRYFAKWQDIVKRNKRRRKSQTRRSIYADLNKRAQEDLRRQQKLERERAEILEALQDTARIKAEQEKAKEEEAKASRVREQTERLTKRNERIQAREAELQRLRDSRTSSKRKSVGEASEMLEEARRKIPKTTLHRRTQSSIPRTADRSSGPIISHLETPPRPYVRNIFNGKPHNGQYYPIGSTKAVDRTHTDYFRLKALGVDPNTTIIPHTDESLAAAQRQELERKRAAMTPPRVRRGVRSSNWEKQKQQWAREDSAENTRRIESRSASSPTRPWSAESVSSVVSSVGLDEIYREHEEWKKTLTETTEWMKNERLKLEEQAQEEMRRSQSSQGSSATQLDVNGYATVNGYKVLPHPSTPGKPLNRLEQRIMETGALGLATAPIPGTAAYEARERARSRNNGRLNGISSATSTPKDPTDDQSGALLDPAARRRRINNNGLSYKPKLSDRAVASNSNTDQLRPDGRFNSVNNSTFQHPSTSDYPQDTFFVSDDEDDLDSENYLGEGNVPMTARRMNGLHNGVSEEDETPVESEIYGDDDQTGDYSDEEEDEDEDDDEDEEEEESEEALSDLANHAYLNIPKTVSAGGVPMSRVTSASGTGASVEDAFVLSDSD